MSVNRNNKPSITSTIFLVLISSSGFLIISAFNASVSTKVEGDGFHRIVKYYVDTGGFKNDSCHISVFVSLPISLYVNVDELADLRRLHESNVCSEGEVDVELFAEKARYQNFTICTRLRSTKTVLSVPVHQRYRFATTKGHAYVVKLFKPKLLLGCKDRITNLRVSKYKICKPCLAYAKKWREVPYQWKGDGNFTWIVPVGNANRKFEVTLITLFITIGGAVYVLWAINNSYKKPRERKIK
ncbi:hypothetical protein QAD02_015694 [Eretmocerus hayati]|uniref:Uncharacterized protein n=1 Tax=Eretmocerus hayati TaxID=131215 RepID=A0ACC2P8Z5_9HYME|nr:hypothetical protein QAD02_015694 [Eretmocerus hayati]